MKHTLMLGAAVLVAGCGTMREPHPLAIGAEEQAAIIAALKTNRRPRPLIAIVGANEGSETTDFLVPFSVLKRADVADVVAVTTHDGPMTLMPALTIRTDETIATLDARAPEGADYVIVPALHDASTPAIVRWIREQREKGAVIVGICSGARVLSAAGLLEGRRATGHWYDIDDLRDDNPSMEWVRDRRYVVDGGIVTTTGVSASVPVSLALVEAIGGTLKARAIADDLGIADWGAAHDSEAFHVGRDYIWTVIWNTVSFWTHDTFAIEVTDGVDEVTLAFTADPYGRTYRSQALAYARGTASPRTRYGIVIVPDLTDATVGDATVLSLATSKPPIEALNSSLSDIQQRFGATTAGWVARQLEYPWAIETKSTAP